LSLERQSIEKKDFPIGRRGYDPDAVDAHLAKLADEVDQLKVSSRRRSETLASTASEQVRAIVEAAETSAAEIQRQAEEEARDIRAEATSEAQTAREQATAQARDYVGKVSESTSVMLQRLDAMESELSALIESLRTGSNRLGADLQLLEGNLSDVRGAVEPRPRFEREADAPPERASATAAAPPAAAPAPPPAAAPPPPAWSPPVATGEEPPAPHHQPEPDGHDAPPAYAAETAPELDHDSDDTEGARLIALNMALNGTPREETDKYLSENFALQNRIELLDEVYASVDA
jgi:DivIVA domain-containing protein